MTDFCKKTLWTSSEAETTAPEQSTAAAPTTTELKEDETAPSESTADATAA